MFTCEEDAKLRKIVEGRGGGWEHQDWEAITTEMGNGFTMRQIMDRWYFYLRPGISNEDFSIGEKRECLQASMTETGNWGRIAARVGNGLTRSSAQVKSAVNTLQGKLRKIGLQLKDPEDVELLPDVFFTKQISASEAEEIRKQFLDAHLEAARKRMNKQPQESESESE
jgi:hypothetical protein